MASCISRVPALQRTPPRGVFVRPDARTHTDWRLHHASRCCLFACRCGQPVHPRLVQMLQAWRRDTGATRKAVCNLDLVRLRLEAIWCPHPPLLCLRRMWCGHARNAAVGLPSRLTPDPPCRLCRMFGTGSPDIATALCLACTGDGVCHQMMLTHASAASDIASEDQAHVRYEDIKGAMVASAALCVGKHLLRGGLRCRCVPTPNPVPRPRV